MFFQTVFFAGIFTCYPAVPVEPWPCQILSSSTLVKGICLFWSENKTLDLSFWHLNFCFLLFLKPNPLSALVPAPKWFHNERDSFVIKRVWQIQCATGRRNKARLRWDKKWGMTDSRRKSYENGPRWFCFLRVVYLSNHLQGEFIWRFSPSLLRIQFKFKVFLLPGTIKHKHWLL